MASFQVRLNSRVRFSLNSLAYRVNNCEMDLYYLRIFLLVNSVYSELKIAVYVASFQG
jgi:hypothetical protein